MVLLSELVTVAIIFTVTRPVECGSMTKVGGPMVRSGTTLDARLRTWVTIMVMVAVVVDVRRSKAWR
jgi:hypothetical protein